ncbi:glycoside hydrolase family 127 protein [Niabella ginsengisoli]|uniref:Glycoside hydrolase family 127 protein n=1 Tax=Niabella ginsengisoli TaxID=522298 RepID=A0ABS9SML1_9BACT|nr:glycoside hydrolase family 127 protein [Niabella ginsengisoli]MCH5599598.1 glycoside hydrolase family 127 protein [Niabella ginsengisoli]
MKIALFFILGVMAVSFVSAQSYVPEFDNDKIKVKPVVALESYAFNLKDVRLLDGPFKKAADAEAAYLLSLEPDRLLYRFYENAGLPTKGKIYGGWESRGVSGHSLGHYLSACALHFAATADDVFKERADYIIKQLALCQDKRKTGYVGGIPDEDRIWKQVAAGDIRSQGFDLNGGWVPWYTVHKVLSGILDAYLYTDNQQAKHVAIKLCDWVIDVTNKLSDEQMQKMLACEHGGMNDALANMYAITGDQKYLDIANRFYHRHVLDPLSMQKDELAGKHANTQIPKVIGCARIYETSANQKDKNIADFFWQTVTTDHSYVIGGNSLNEHFGEPNKLNDRLDGNTTETCNTYNMLKLSRHLFAWNSLAKYNDYYERALYNHILASQNPDNGMVCYYVPLRMGGEKEFSTPFESFWCCTGTGMENHVKYGENIYARSKDGGLYVNLFIPSVLNWKEKGVTITQQTKFPESDVVNIQIQTQNPQTFPVLIRHPKWASAGVDIYVNEQKQSVKKGSDGYISISRKWKDNDQIKVVAKMNLYTESMPDNKNRIAMLYGPVVLSGLLGKELKDPLMVSPVWVSNKEQLLAHTKPVADKPLLFRTAGVGQPFDVTLQPFYKTYDQHYSVYWDLFTQSEWQQKKLAYEAEKKRLKELEDRTTDFLGIGEMQPERDHNLEGENTTAGEFGSRKWRHAENGGWFAFDMKVDPRSANELIVTYWGSDAGKREFDIYVNDVKIATQTLNKNVPEQFFDVSYKIPKEAVQKEMVKVRFQAHPNKTAGGVYGCRMVRK